MPSPRPKMPVARPARAQDHLAAGDAGVLAGLDDLRDDRPPGDLVRRPVVALLDRDLVREELLHVLDHRDAQREDGQAEQRRRPAGCRGRRPGSRGRRARAYSCGQNRNATRNATPHIAEIRNHSATDPLRALLRARARDRPGVRRCARPRRRRGSPPAAPAAPATWPRRRPSETCGGCGVSVGCGGSLGVAAVPGPVRPVGSGGAHAFAPSQIAIPTIAASPKMKATMPSAVGPIPPAS